ncbi:hypothetical protein PVK06_014227 [Gossypium arboreum]|uniref:Uncharacterized protein n=1 Tax=Gossypium arboreum TaxID=29729 RepID=A0ABR0PUH2_GOSAR|nr:hypothetical protein PVK06_014227 [Gossypium arboreum]
MLYVEECWNIAGGSRLRVKVAFIKQSQVWEIQKYEGPHTCIVARALPHCKPIVQVNDTWLYGKYKKTLLIAVTLNEN